MYLREIKTERLVLKPLGKQFLESTIRYAMDLENTRWMCHLPDETVGEVEAFLTGAENEWKKENPDFLEFAVVYKGEHIGAVSVYLGNGTGELGWIIRKDHWGKGFAPEAAKALMEHVEAERKITHFMAHCDTQNTASYKVMEKLGMVRTGKWGGRRNRAAAEDSCEYRYETVSK